MIVQAVVWEHVRLAVSEDAMVVQVLVQVVVARLVCILVIQFVIIIAH